MRRPSNIVMRLALGLGLLLLASNSTGCRREAGAVPRDGKSKSDSLHAGSPVVGRWVGAGGARILEFLGDGTLVEVRELDGYRSVREPDGTFRKEPMKSVDCGAGSFRFDAADTIGFEVHWVGRPMSRSGVWKWSIDPASGGLTLVESGSTEPAIAYVRDDPVLSPVAARLVGLWRRVGNPTLDYVDMGVRYTPGGLAIVVGKNTHWDASSSSGSSSWLCSFSRYRVVGENTLEDVRPSFPESPRSRQFRVDADRLAIVKDGREDHVYQRVHGVIPFSEGRLDVRAWNALE